MAYNADMTWNDLVRLLSIKNKSTMSAVREGNAEYLEFQSFRAGRSDLQIAIDLAKDEADIANMTSSFAGHLAMRQFMENDGAALGTDHAFNFRLFS